MSELFWLISVDALNSLKALSLLPDAFSIVASRPSAVLFA